MSFDFEYSYDEFPKWLDECEGMKVIPGDWNNIRATVPDPVKYAEKEGKELYIHFMFPETMDEDRKYPLILHVRGSAWYEQNMPGHMGDYADIVKNGFAVGFVQYRSAELSRAPAQILDLKTAARYVYEHRDEYPIDINNVFLAGDSSGGHTAILGYLTWGEGYLDNDDEEGPLPKLRGLIDFYGVTDVKKLSEGTGGLPKESYESIGDGLLEVKDDEHFAEINAMCYVDLKEELAPVLIMHGNKDRLVPLSQSIDFYNALKERGTEVDFYMVDEADHGGPLFWSPKVTEVILEFLKKNCE